MQELMIQEINKHLKTIKMLILQTNKQTNDGINKKTWTN